MRRLLVIVFAAILPLTLVAPADAARPSRSRSASTSANAFWYHTEQLSRSSYRIVVWYVGIYRSSEGTWSDLYKESVRCRTTRGGETCEVEEFLYGESNLSGQTFSIDADELTAAHLDATYQVQELDRDWNAVGRAFPVHIVADWAGVGDIQRSRESFTYRSGCVLFRYTARGAFRAAEATASVNGTDLGETYEAWLGSSTSSSFEKSC